MAQKGFTTFYVSVEKEDDIFIDNLRLAKIKEDKRQYTKNDILKYLVLLGREVVEGRYIKPDPSIDEFVSQLQEVVIELNNKPIRIKKSKEQVYNMLIEKGLQNLER